MCLFCSAYNLFQWEIVPFFLSVSSTECAESASFDAYVCEVNVPIHDVGDDIPYCSSSKFVGYKDEHVHFDARAVEQFHRILNGNVVSTQRLVEYTCDFRIDTVDEMLEGGGEGCFSGDQLHMSLQETYPSLSIMDRISGFTESGMNSFFAKINSG